MKKAQNKLPPAVMLTERVETKGTGHSCPCIPDKIPLTVKISNKNILGHSMLTCNAD